MNDINIDVACEARFALERSCVPLACARRSEEQLSVMRRELHRQTSPDLSEEWCASDVAPILCGLCAKPRAVLSAAGAVEGCNR